MENRILEILEDNAFTVHNYKEHYINTNNGILNDEHLEREKKHLLSESVSYLIEEIVTSKQHYPKDDLSKVELETDFIVMRREDFETLKQYTSERAIQDKKIKEAIDTYLEKNKRLPSNTMEALEITDKIIGENE